MNIDSVRLLDWSVAARREQPRPSGMLPWCLSELEWKAVEPIVKDRVSARRRGKPSGVDQRAHIDAILYVLGQQIAWADLPIRFPPKSTVHAYFMDLRRSGRLRQVYHLLFQPRWRASDVDEQLGAIPRGQRRRSGFGSGAWHDGRTKV